MMSLFADSARSIGPVGSARRSISSLLALTLAVSGWITSTSRADTPKRYVLVTSYECFLDNCSFENAVLRYDSLTGAFVNRFVQNIDSPYGIAMHPLRETLMVASREGDLVNEYDSFNGAFLRTFVKAHSCGMNYPQHILFKSDGSLLVTSAPNVQEPDWVNGILEYSGVDGRCIGTFIDGGSIAPQLPEDCGDPRCIRGANGMAMGPNGHLYVASDLNNAIFEFDMPSGDYVGVFETPANGKLDAPQFLLIRPAGTTRAGNILVTTSYPEPDLSDSILEFNAATRQIFLVSGRDFGTGVVNPGAMMWHETGKLLLGDRTLSQSPPNFADRLAYRDPLTGVAMGTLTPSTENRIHFNTQLFQLSIGFASDDNDLDSDVDMKDWAALQRCFGRNPSLACRGPFDDNESKSIGYGDYTVFRRKFGGPARGCSSAADCDDANACTTDACASNACIYTPVADGAACADALFCNGAETCRAGVCRGQMPCIDAAHCNEAADSCFQCLTNTECDDGKVCTTDVCQPNNTCAYVNNNLVCNDGNACTSNDRCSAGTCQGGPPVNCNDSNLCTTDSCNTTTGCTHIHNTVTCNDGSACTVGDRCLLGTCRGGPLPVCEDNNPCTQNDCNPNTGCVFPATPPGGSCEDGNACTSGDTCTAGVCVPGAPLNCDDAVSCTVDTCNAGACVHTANNALCNDNLFCTGTETCNVQTGCVSSGNPCGGGQSCNEAGDFCGQCNTNADCNDNVACTTDTCNQQTHTCSNVVNNAACNDGQFCNGTETCNAQTGCVAGTPVNCNDGIPCTTDACNEATDACTHTPVNSVCNDNIFCNGAETCNAQTGCANGTPVNCNDNIACTVDACDEAGDTCTHTPNNAVCNDAQFCNGVETCNAQTGCVAGTAVNCNDNVACTVDACDEGGDTCTHAPNNAACDDGLFCTGTETCNAQTGCSSSGDPCSGTFCDEQNNACGECSDNGDCDDGIACTVDTCNLDMHECQHTANNAACSDGVFCNGAEVCVLGVGCQDVPDLVCDDGLACTQDSCSESQDRCVFSPINSRCNDANPCTDDACSPITGCINSRDDTNVCGNTNPCDGVDHCVNRVCVTDAPPVCEDNNPCTLNVCTTNVGCQFPANDAGSCDDGENCDGVEFCSGGTCQNGTPMSCDDSEPCTTDSCSNGTCHNDDNTDPCDDGDLCTDDDTCSGGSCAGTPATCPDGKTCNPSNGNCEP